MVRFEFLLNDEGQVTIEFVLIIVIMLVVISTVTFPVVNSMTESTEDTAMAVHLASAQRRIINTAEEVSMGSCGSFKTIGVYVKPDLMSQPNIMWDEDVVWGNFSNASLYEEELRSLPYPDYIRIDGGTCAAGGCDAKNNTVFITITKDCSALRPTTVCPVLGYNGFGVNLC